MSYFDAYRAARKAPVQAWVEASFAPVVRQDPLTEDEASDEEMDMDELRHQAKNASRGIVASGCLPSDGQRPASRKSASANMMMLSEAAVLLQDITAQPRETQSKTWKIWQKLQAEDLLPGTDGNIKSGTSTKSSTSTCAAPTHDTPSCERQSSPGKLSSARRHSQAVKAARNAEFFCMDVAEDEPSGKGAARDSSLARGYEALGATHYDLDDDFISEPHGAAAGRESSINRCYDALGQSASGVMERAASRACDLQPVRVPSRQRRRSVCTGASAMDLDLGLCSTAAKGQLANRSGAGVNYFVRTPSPAVQKSQSKSMGSAVRVTRSDAKDANGLTLPRLPGRGLAMKTGSGGIPFSEVSSRRPSRGLNTSLRAVF